MLFNVHKADHLRSGLTGRCYRAAAEVHPQGWQHSSRCRQHVLPQRCSTLGRRSIRRSSRDYVHACPPCICGWPKGVVRRWCPCAFRSLAATRLHNWRVHRAEHVHIESLATHLAGWHCGHLDRSVARFPGRCQPRRRRWQLLGGQSRVKALLRCVSDAAPAPAKKL